MAFGKLGSGFGRLGIPLGGVSAIAWPSQRAPKTTDDVTKGFLVNDVWQANGKVYQLNDNTQGAAVWVDITPNGLPLDQPGVSAVYAYGTSLLTSNTNVKALNKCFDLWRSSDQTTITVGWSANGDVDAATADAFAAPAIAGGGTCEITKWYDQSFNVGTGALNSNDATALPGWGILTPTIASGGSGMTDGTQTFTIVGTNMVPAQVSGTVTGGVLSGALIVISRGSYLNQLANGASSTYGGPGTPPTFNFTWTAQAPQWTANTVNGKRVVTVPAVYGPSLVFVAQSLTLPSSASVPGATHTVVMAAQARAVLSTTLNTLFCLGIPQTDYALELNNSTSVPGVGYVGARSANLPPHTGPAIWALQSGVSSQAISINNDAGTVTVAAAGTRSGGSVGGGAPSPSRPGADDVMAFMAWGSTLSAPNLLNVRAATAIVSNTAPQTRRNRIVCIGDSIAFGLKSANGTPWPRLIQMLGYVPSSVDVLNFGYPGGWFSGGGNHDFTANEATDWANIYSATTPLILVPIALGTNDMVTTDLLAAHLADRRSAHGF